MAYENKETFGEKKCQVALTCVIPKYRSVLNRLHFLTENKLTETSSDIDSLSKLRTSRRVVRYLRTLPSGSHVLLIVHIIIQSIHGCRQQGKMQESKLGS